MRCPPQAPELSRSKFWARTSPSILYFIRSRQILQNSSARERTEGGQRRKRDLAELNQLIFSIKNDLISPSAILCCFIESRSRMVTVPSLPAPSPPIVSKPTVTQKGVPASSCRR